MIGRREVIAGLGAAAWPLAARGQQATMPVVGFLSFTSATVGYVTAGFRQGLQDTGYIEGRNVAVEYRFAEGDASRLPALAADLVRRRVAVIAVGSRGDAVAKQATTTIPIVFLTGDDPVRDGLVVNLNRPGGNLTGATTFAGELGPKRFGLLHEMVPQAAGIAILVDPNVPDDAEYEQQFQSAGRNIGLPVRIIRAGSESDFDASFATLGREGAKALMVAGSSYFNLHRERLTALSNRYGIPAMYELREFVEAGGLMSYGVSISEVWRQVGVYTGRILKGEKPADLPVLQPAKFEFVINLKTVKALGLTVPPSLLATADEVIE